MKTNSHAKISTLVQISLLGALVIVLQLFFSSVQFLGPVTLNFVLVPIVIAGIFISPLAGLIIGALAGITTFFQVFTSGNTFYVFLMANNPIATAIVCILKTALAGYAAGLLYRLLDKISKYRLLNVLVSSVACPVINTGLFCTGMYVFFGNAFINDVNYAQSAADNLMSFIIFGLVGINFIAELVLNVILCPIISKALFSTKFFK